MTDGGLNPALRVVLSLPTCAGGSDQLGVWMSSALAPYVEVPLSPVIPVPVSDAIRDVPILRDLGPPACVTAGRMGVAVGWEARDPSSMLLARAAGIGASSRSVPDRMIANTHSYHQEWIGSGQPLSGFIEGDRVEAIIDHRIVVLELPAANVESYDDGVELEARLLRDRLAPLAPPDAFGLPTVLPPGLRRCTAPVWVGRPTVVTEYCDGAGRTMTVGWGPIGDRSTGAPAALGGLPALLEDRPGGARRITLAHPRAPGVAVWAEATPDIEVDQLVAALESIPALESRVLSPGVGSGDLRRSFSEPWLRSKLEGIGARISSVDDRRRGGLRFLSVSFTVDRRELVGVFAAQAPLPFPLGNMTGVVTEADVDLYVVESHQAYGYCGNIFLNVSDPNARRPGAPRLDAAPSAVDIARALVRELAD